MKASLEAPDADMSMERFLMDAFYWFAPEKFNEGTAVYRGE